MSLQADNISLHLTGFDLLREVSLAIKPGEVTAIVGPNGAGKSSLMRALSGDMAVTGGVVALNDKPLQQWPLEQRARMMAVLPQHTPLGFPFTAGEVVALGRIPHNTGNIRDKEIVAEALEAVDGRYLQQRYYTNMSGGEKQRVQLARVLAQIWEPSDFGPRYLLLDEPTSAFDLSHQLITLDIIRRCADEGVGVLLVLHDLNLASRCADHLIALTCGSIAAQGSPTEVLTEALIKQVFGVDAVISTNPLTGTPMVIT